MPCSASCAAASTNGSPRTHATTTVSLKKIVRGLRGPMRGACRLVLENTAICDSTGVPSAPSTAPQIPRADVELECGRALAQLAIQFRDRILRRPRCVADGRMIQPAAEQPFQVARRARDYAGNYTSANLESPSHLLQFTGCYRKPPVAHALTHACRVECHSTPGAPRRVPLIHTAVRWPAVSAKCVPRAPPMPPPPPPSAPPPRCRTPAGRSAGPHTAWWSSAA